MTKRLVVTALFASLIAFAPAADALYIWTPLQLAPSATQAHVGDTIHFTIAPTDENDTATMGGRTVSVHWQYDPNEGSETPPPEGEESQLETGVLLESLELNENAKGEFDWTIPADVDNHNVGILLKNTTDDEEIVGIVHVAVGDAVPVMYSALASSGEPAEETGDGESPAPTDDAEPTNEAPPASDDALDAPEQGAGDEGRSVPAAGVLALVGALAAVAALVARRR